MTLINGMRQTELMVEHGIGVRASRIVKFKRLDDGIFSQEDRLALWAYQVFALEVRFSGKCDANHSKGRAR